MHGNSTVVLLKSWEQCVKMVVGCSDSQTRRQPDSQTQAAQIPELSRDPFKFRVGARAKVDTCARTPPVPLTVKAMKHALHWIGVGMNSHRFRAAARCLVGYFCCSERQNRGVTLKEGTPNWFSCTDYIR